MSWKLNSREQALRHHASHMRIGVKTRDVDHGGVVSRVRYDLTV